MRATKLVCVMLISMTLGGVAYADGYYGSVEQRIQSDAAYLQKRQQAIELLKKRGYQTQKVEAYNHQGRGALSIKATKSGQRHEIIMTYPDLRILREKKE
ncbi:MAG: PepSY domain-containing protein [Moraxella sp.]|nr:PepSY domain-containing protein [Moraxella sp.]